MRIVEEGQDDMDVRRLSGKTYPRDNGYEGDGHDKILHKENND
jgi:hypothetical protein